MTFDQLPASSAVFLDAIPRRTVDEIQMAQVTVLPVTAQLVSQAVDLSRQFGLLSGDALIVAVMRDHGLTQLAGLDDDFDRVSWLTRFSRA